MAIDRAAIERIDSTLMPQLDRHHLRLLIHCLDSFQSMAAPREHWCNPRRKPTAPLVPAATRGR